MGIPALKTRQLASLSGLTLALLSALGCEALKPAKLDQFVVDSGTDGPIDSDDTDAEPTPTPVARENNAPRANAGPDQVGLDPEQAVLLDGSASSDLDGDPLQYQWVLSAKPAGSIASVTNPNSVTAQVFVDRPGEYALDLTVTDGIDVDTDRLMLRVDEENQAPVAEAGFDQVVSLGATVQLSGAASFDPDRDPLNYNWSFDSRPPGSVATLNGATVQPAISPRFSADATGRFAIRLIVDDGDLSSAPDIVYVDVQDSSSSSGGGGSSDCLDCSAEDVGTTLRAGDAASGLGLVALPLLALLWHRRRDEA